MKPVISVIIPCYNVEKYISDAIESIMAQTFMKWEIVIVDDCSTDKTLDIAKKYEKKDERIKVYQLNKNSGGAFTPRKVAIEKAVGEWIHCLDADDFVAKDCLERLFERAVEIGADCVHQTFQAVTENKEKLANRLPASNFDFSQILTGEEACRMTVGEWKINANGGLIKKRIFIKSLHDYQMDYIGSHSDELITRFILLNSKLVGFCDVKYWRRENPTSVTRIVSIVRFSFLPCYYFLSLFIKERFPQDRALQQTAEVYFWRGLSKLTTLYERHYFKIKKTERQIMLQMLREYWEKVDKEMIAASMSSFSKAMSMHRFELFLFFNFCQMFYLSIRYRITKK